MYVDSSDMYASVEEDWDREKAQALENLKNAVSISNYPIMNLIGELNITDSNQISWLFNNKTEAQQLIDFLDDNRYSGNVTEEVKNFAKGIVEVNRILDGQIEIKTTGKFPQELDSCCPGGCCPDPLIYGNDKIINEYGIKPIQSAVDGTFNMLASTIGLFKSDEAMGGAIRKFMNELGYDIPPDVLDEYLGSIYRIRKRDGILVIEYKPGLLRNMLDVGLDTLDIISFLSPSKGGGAFLAIKSGGKITITSITNHIRKISIDSAKIDEAINFIRKNEIFSLNGTGEYRIVKGHHPLAKIAFSGDKFYDFQKAFSVSVESLENAWKKANTGIPINLHAKITGQQNSLYSAFKSTGSILTLNKMAESKFKH